MTIIVDGNCILAKFFWKVESPVSSYLHLQMAVQPWWTGLVSRFQDLSLCVAESTTNSSALFLAHKLLHSLLRSYLQWCLKFSSVAQSCPTLCDPHGLLHGILQARILEWVAFPLSRGSSRPRNQTRVSCIAGGFFTNWALRLSLQKNNFLIFHFSSGITSREQVPAFRSF